MNQSPGKLEPTNPSDESTSINIRRCAVYARVSSSNRDDTPLSSIEAQIESCKAYIHAQKGMGWELIEPVYADDGYSGGSMERPALQRLFQDMEEGKIDAVVIQRLDRICRSVRDISDLIPLFTIPGIALVSVNQLLDTESPQGRLLINMLTSFAQFEREQSGERTRDKISTARANGKWQHNGVPLGYYQDERQELQVDASEAAIVKDIFQRFSEAASVDALIIELADQGYRSKVRVSQQGNRAGGKPIDRNGLYRILNNRMYLGELFYRQEWRASKHQPIIKQGLWDQVHEILNRRARRKGVPTTEDRWIFFPLGNRLYWHDGRPYKMYESSNRGGLRYRYYKGAATPQEKATDTGPPTIRAAEIHDAVIKHLLEQFENPQGLLDNLPVELKDLPQFEPAHVIKYLAHIVEMWGDYWDPIKSSIILDLVARVTIFPDQDQIEVTLDFAGLKRMLTVYLQKQSKTLRPSSSSNTRQ
jgi:DNA invertase Pin-like site-specific DNA recombinase